jgi:hypothetical protein
MIVNEIALALLGCGVNPHSRWRRGLSHGPASKTLKDLVVEHPAVLAQKKRRRNHPMSGRDLSVALPPSRVGYSCPLSDRGAFSCFPAETLADLLRVGVENASTKAETGTGLVLTTLAAAQFLMLLDSSVMNVAIATVAKDVGTTVTGIQTAITMYTLVMAMFMVTGGKFGSMYGRKRIFMIGCIVYGLGSLTTALAPNLPILILGWSFLRASAQR